MFKFINLDVQGVVLIVVCIFMFVLVIELGGCVGVLWLSLGLFIYIIFFVVFGVFFYLIELCWVKNFILLFELFKEVDILVIYVVIGMQMVVQLGFVFVVLLYFQVIERVSNTVVGVCLILVVVGNVVGGILVGVFINWYVFFIRLGFQY